MVEVKADALEQSFEAFEEGDDGVAALTAELELLKAKIASGAIIDPTGGTNADSEARTAIVAILGALRAHGLIAP